MIGIDTNVLVRFLVDDDIEQNIKARNFMAGRSPDDPAYVSAITLVELVWVLNRRLDYSKAAIFEMLRALLSADSLVIENMEELDALLNDEGDPSGDLADHMIAWSSARVGCARVVTFDQAAAKHVPGMELLA